ncbi:MAG: hypothetical protein KDB68_07840 [Planctomycetes bacterium]|nr:hypothetical protein [Planctomycetota bacterium]MCA8936103.1 hypothetical protein [Planctomycetota bacterium]
MPYFVVTIEYIQDMSVVEEHTPAHRAFSAGLKERGLLLMSGPFNPRTGGMLLLKAESVNDAVAAFEDDPFKKLDIAKYDIREWIPKVGIELFEQ